MTEKQFFKEKLFILVVTILLASGCSEPDPTVYVDPNIGGVAPLLTTKNPTVHRPNSMVRVFPVTEPGLTDRFLSDKIYGFALNMPAYRMGHVSELMPYHGEIQPDRNKTAAFYDHDLEEVHPWYHRVLLEEPDIITEWTTTERAVLYRFDFSEKSSNHIILRTSGNSHIEISSNTISGWEEFQNTRQYFFIESNLPAIESGFIQSDEFYTEISKNSGRELTVWFSFAKLETPVELRVGISYISSEQARQNLTNETNSKSFDDIKQEGYQIWKDVLGKIRVEGGTERQKRIFYTSLYRSHERMVNISEEGKYFSGYDRKVHESDSRPFYVDDWLWDTFRSLHPLGLIIHPKKEADMVQSYTYLYNYAGKPWKTQYRIRQVMDLWFDDSPLGLPGDEDGGSMCSWYVLSAMGFYPVTPGTGIYAIGSPFFEQVEIALPNGKTFTIEADNNSKRNKYIQAAQLNDQPINRPWLTHDEIMNGGVLKLEMDERANKTWGTNTDWYWKNAIK